MGSSSKSNENDEYLRYNDRVQRMRDIEYAMLKGITYLDHAGTALPSKSLVEQFSRQLQKLLITNTHSALASAPDSPQAIIDSTRKEVLGLFGASPDHFEVIFTSNATGGVKLLAEALSGHEEGFAYYYHRDCHTSIVGVRELARSNHCLASDKETETWLNQAAPNSNANQPILFAYPAQSNMNGRRLPLDWPHRLRKRSHSYTLLDIAALASTTPLDLSIPDTAPDFMTLSFYKIFGFPDLGALIVRKSAAQLFDKRRYFGGGTTESVACGDGDNAWVVRKSKSLSSRLEDGTLPTHNILALKCAIEVHQQLYGGLGQVSRHVSWLTKQMYEQLRSLKHENGAPVCTFYKDIASDYNDPRTQGGVVAFNIMDPHGMCYGSQSVGTHAIRNGIFLRSGSLCNPAGMAHALGFNQDELRRAFEAGYRCGEDQVPLGRPFGMVRVSLGSCSTLKDVETFVRFVKVGYVNSGAEPEVGWRWKGNWLCGARRRKAEILKKIQRQWCVKVGGIRSSSETGSAEPGGFALF